VTEERVRGGTSVFTYEWMDADPKPALDAVNTWERRCIETRPDTTKLTVYSNRGGATLVKILKDSEGASLTRTFNYLNSNYRLEQRVENSGILGVGEPSAPTGFLLVATNPSHGLFRNYEYYSVDDTSDGAAPGYLKAEYVQEGGGQLVLRRRHSCSVNLPTNYLGKVRLPYISCGRSGNIRWLEPIVKMLL